MDEESFLLGETEYQNGLEFLNGNPEDKHKVRKAYQCFSIAAEKGHIEAIVQIGYLNMFGEPNIMRNYSKAFSCFSKAAKEGLAIAEFYLAECYLMGFGTEQNEATAFDYYQKAAKQEYFPAVYKLSELYLHGIGVERDLDKAMYYNNKTKSSGNINSDIRYLSIIRAEANTKANM